MKQLNAIFGGSARKIANAQSIRDNSTSSPSTSSPNSLRRVSSVPAHGPVRPQSPRRPFGRVGPIEILGHDAAERVAFASAAAAGGGAPANHEPTTLSFKASIQSNARGLVKRLPTMKKLLGESSTKKTGSMNSISPHSSNRRIRRRDFTFVPAAPTPEKMKKLRFVILPRSNWKVRWDLWIGFIIGYSVIMIPYRIGFAVDLEKWEQILNYLFDLSFATDVGFNFFTGYFDGDVFVYDLPKIRWRYLKSWFVFDLLSTLPMDQFFQAVTATVSPSDPSLFSFKLLRTIRLVRLLKLMRLLRLKRAVDTIQMDALNAHVLQTVKSLMMIIFIIHLISCAWYAFYTWDPTGINWVTFMNPNGIANPYLVCFYWVANTMMSVGYGDIYGITDNERMFSIFVECLGSISVGLIIANIQMLTENYNPRGVIMKQKLQETKEFLLKRSIPRRLRQRVISQFEYHWSRRTVFDEDEMLHQFPKSLQYELLAASMESFVKKFPFFGMTSVDFFVFTIPRLRPIVVGPGQTLVEAESVWEELYFVLSGSLDAMRGNIVASSLVGGDICGVEYLIGSRRRYVHSYVSTSKTELFAIYSADLIRAMDLCAISTKYLKDLAHILAARYADAARRGRKTIQKQENGSMRRASIELFLQYRHRKSPSHGNIMQAVSGASAADLKKFHLSVSDDIHLHWSIIRHYSRVRILWDTIMGVIVVWTTISVPFRISFSIPDTNFLDVTDRLSDGLFFLDICFNFVTTYIDETGVEIINRHEIRKHYLKKSFFVDVISTIPFDFLVERITVTGDFRSLKLFRTIKLVKLLRLVRIMKIFKLNSQRLAEMDISMDTVRLLKLLAPVLTIAHYVGCFWYYMSADHDAKDAWWGRIHFDDPDSTMSKYIASVYWATTTMATVGFGDIYAVNSYEQMYSIFVMIGGTTLFAFVVGTVIEVVSNSKSLMNREHEMGQRINAYIKERGVSREFVLACQEHLRYINGEKTLFFEQALFDALSHSLRCELILYLNNTVLSQIRFFDKKPKWFLTLLLPRLVPQFFLQGDLLIYHGNLSSGIFFLMSGTVVARVPRSAAEMERNESVDDGSSMAPSEAAITFSTNGRTTDTVPDQDGTIATLHEGEFFGYKEVLTRSAAQYNVFACVPTGTYILPREFLDTVRELYPGVLDEMRTLFLHSITKQQTILQHWHNNEMMGISIEESKQIFRATDEHACHRMNGTHSSGSHRLFHGSSAKHGLGHVHEEGDGDSMTGDEWAESIINVRAMQLHPLASVVDAVVAKKHSDTHTHVQPEPSQTILPMNTAITTSAPSREISRAGSVSLQMMTRAPNASDIAMPVDDSSPHGPDAEMYGVNVPHDESPATASETGSSDTSFNKHQFRRQGTNHGDDVAFDGGSTNGSTRAGRINSEAISVSAGMVLPPHQPPRRSSMVTPQRPKPPPLFRHPSMPEEINALVKKLLEVEGYRNPNAENLSEDDNEQEQE